MTRHLVILTAVIGLGATASAVYAHHSHPYFYDSCKNVTIEGRVERVEWKDPHTWVFLKQDDGTAYTVDWAGLSQLTQKGTINSAKAAVVFGARLSVTGNPIRTTAEIREHFAEFTSVVNPNTLDPKTIRRVDNSFNWAMQSPPDCTRK